MPRDVDDDGAATMTGPVPRVTLDLVAAEFAGVTPAVRPDLDAAVVAADIDVMLWSMRLYRQRRYFHQRFWEDESRASVHAERVEGFPRLENVAEHSWHVADSCLLLAPHFDEVDALRAAALAVLHDKMEISTGDESPIARDGTGRGTHAFDHVARLAKEARERDAAAAYLDRLPPRTRALQRALLDELLAGRTPEARFVKGVDKLQALAYVLAKKRGDLPDKHLLFTVRYTRKAQEYYPPLSDHLYELWRRLIAEISRRRKQPEGDLWDRAFAPDRQLRLF